MSTINDETAEQQIDRLAEFIMFDVPGEPSQSQGAVDTAIRLLALRQDRLIETLYALDAIRKRECELELRAERVRELCSRQSIASVVEFARTVEDTLAGRDSGNWGTLPELADDDHEVADDDEDNTSVVRRNK